ncbi:hypothetical protein J3U16_02455 [Gilliamella sp. B3023]|uniref:hypothetical protein n=1 Tax=Gilliamella sp. B3023 TaxID=2817987 RepID=UPI00226AD916|nr:hypothetical protein [Gilliamella sp. B3023]MCX8674147.1 hypothetical protein [Gilliamella sp. B3023]
MLIKIESFYGDSLLSGLVSSVAQLKHRVMAVLADCDLGDFISIFCARYGYYIYPYDERIQVDYVVDLDIYKVYKPIY